MTIVVLHRGNPIARELMPQLLARVRALSERLEGVGDPGILCRSIELNFLVPDPQIIAIVAVDDDGRVVGHAVCSLDQWLGHKYVMVLQYALDGALSREAVRKQMAKVEEWGRNHGAVELRALVTGDTLERAYRIFYGFQRKQVLMTKPIPQRQEA
jgi:hypothetical protein